MIAGYHLVWTAYGWWLPNDPRGSTSREVCSAALAPLGDLHYGRKRIQPAGRMVREFYDAAHGVLKHALLTLTPEETLAVAAAFGEVVHWRNYTCYGCAIMPDHVYVLIRKHRDKAEEMIAWLQKQVERRFLRNRKRAAEPIIPSGAAPDGRYTWRTVPTWPALKDISATTRSRSAARSSAGPSWVPMTAGCPARSAS